jgi:hypothetical protein
MSRMFTILYAVISRAGNYRGIPRRTLAVSHVGNDMVNFLQASCFLKRMDGPRVAGSE